MSDNIEKKEENAEPKSFGEVLSDSFKELKETGIAFIKAPKALWGINVPYILEGLVYFGILTILGKFSSENVALEDTQASLVYSFVTGGITFAMLVLGGYSDKIGIRRSLIVAFSAMLLGRVLVSLSGSLGLTGGIWSPMFFMMCIGLLLMVLSYGLYQPAAYAGVKRYTTPKTAGMAYAAIYGFMNLGAFFSGFISSFTRQSFEESFPPNGLTAVFWVYVVITGIALLFTLFMLTKKNDKQALADINEEIRKEGGEEREDDEEDKPAKKKNNNLPAIIYALIAVAFFLMSDLAFEVSFDFEFNFNLFGADIVIDFFFTLFILMFLVAVWEFLRRRPEHPFRDPRFSFFIFVLIPVQTLFAHNWLTIPYYLDRAFAGTVVGEYFEIFSNINPILIFFLAPIVAGLTAKANVYKMMIYGTLVMALPTFLLVLGPNMYLFLLYILIMTIGEAMWQPRFLQWIAEIAPKGMTGLYMGVGQFPWFLTKVITGFYSGWFVMRYIPENTAPQNMNTEMMWLIYGFIALLSPIGLYLAKGWMIKGFKTTHEG